MSYIVFAWIAVFFYGLETIISKLTSKYSLSNPWLFNVTWGFFVLAITTPIAYFYGIHLPTLWGNLLIASLFSALASIFYVLSVFALDVSVFSPLFNLRTVFSVILGGLFLGEILTLNQYLLVLVIVIAAVFVSLDEKFNWRSFFRKPILIGLTEMFLLSLMSVFVKKTVGDIGYWSTAFWIALISEFITFLTFPLFMKDFKLTKPKKYIGTFLIALVSTFGTLASIKATSVNVSISTVIISLPMSMILVFIISRFKPELLEKHSLKIYAIRFVSATIMIIAALWLSM